MLLKEQQRLCQNSGSVSHYPFALIFFTALRHARSDAIERDMLELLRGLSEYPWPSRTSLCRSTVAVRHPKDGSSLPSVLFESNGKQCGSCIAHRVLEKTKHCLSTCSLLSAEERYSRATGWGHASFDDWQSDSEVKFTEAHKTLCKELPNSRSPSRLI